MKTRQISIIAGVLTIIGSVFLMNFLTNQQEPPERNKNKQRKRAVSTIQVNNRPVTATVTITGRLTAEERIELFAEVSGTFLQGQKPFKEGVRYQKGATLIRIDDEEDRMNLVAERSQLLKQITQVMPDLKIDYPESFDKWQEFLENYNVQKRLPPLPEPVNKQVKYFIASRNIYNQYYNIRSRETRLTKYTIKAPFTGVLTQATIDPGTLVRAGQKLGEFINPQSYELEAAVGENELPLISIGDSVFMHSNDLHKGWPGKIVRINNKIDPGTQTAKVFVKMQGEGLKEGMYLEGTIQSQTVQNAIKIPRKLIQSDSLVWIVQDSVLHQQAIQVIQRSKNQAIIKGLSTGAELLNEPIPSAYDGMSVKPVDR